MVQPIMKDHAFLSQKAEAATPEDISTGKDLLETLIAHKEECVGMAANMIGICKRIIAFQYDKDYMVMYNPIIIRKEKPFTATEGCLSLTGRRITTRYESIKVQYQNEAFQTRFKSFTGWTAEIVQHEIDHCEGIVI